MSISLPADTERSALPVPARVGRDRMLAMLREGDFVRVTDLAERFRSPR